MFDSIVHDHRHATPRDFAPMLISWAVHTAVTAAVVLLPLLFATNQLPAVANEVLTFVSVAPPPPPPPPPPPAPAASTPKPAVKRPSPQAAPTAAPLSVERELPPVSEVAGDEEGGSEFGVPGGIPGGVPGGVIGGVVGGIPDLPLPPPPPVAPEPRPPVRTGGQIQAPALLKRVPPVYPPLAVKAKLEGVVILEATVSREGRVEDVKVLRSIPLLDEAAIDAVHQWVYAPLMLNGQAERFVLTVTVSFGLS